MNNYEMDFVLTQGKKMGGNAGRKKDKKKTKGVGENIYNSKHVRLAEAKKTNSNKANSKKKKK